MTHLRWRQQQWEQQQQPAVATDSVHTCTLSLAVRDHSDTGMSEDVILDIQPGRLCKARAAVQRLA